MNSHTAATRAQPMVHSVSILHPKSSLTLDFFSPSTQGCRSQSALALKVKPSLPNFYDHGPSYF